MPQRREVSIHAPLGGVVRRYAYQKRQSQEPYTCPEATNVWPTDPLEERSRIGSRPGTAKAYAEELGSGAAIRLLDQVTVTKRDGYTFWMDVFGGDAWIPAQAVDSTVWSRPVWDGAGGSRLEDMEILPEDPELLVYEGESGLVRAAISELDTAQAYRIDVGLVPYQGEWHGDYSIILRLDNTSPDLLTDGIVATLTMSGDTGAYTGNLKVYEGGSLQNTYNFTPGTGSADPGVFRVLRAPGAPETISCVWQGTTVLAATDISGDLGPSDGGHRAGVAVAPATGGVCIIEYFFWQYFSTDVQPRYQKMLVASADGEVWQTDYLSQLTQKKDGSTISLATDRPLMAAEFEQKLYIADYSEEKIAAAGKDPTAGTTSTANPDQIAGITGWDDLGLDTYNYLVQVSAGTGGTINETYEIQSMAAGYLQTTTNVNDGTVNGTCTVRVYRGPKIFDPVADSLTLWTATSGSGQIPVGCPVIILYRERVTLAFPEHFPNLWYMPRQGDPHDWNFNDDPEDPQRAVSGNDTRSAGVPGEPGRALFSQGDDRLLMGCVGAAYILRGDPAFGGELDQIHNDVGIVSSDAVCDGPGDEIYYLTEDGLYMLPAQENALPVPVSPDLLPQDLKAIDPSRITVQMGYDHHQRAVHIYLVPKNGDQGSHWWYCCKHKSFWSQKLPKDQQPSAIHFYKAETAVESRLLFGSRDGYVRTFNRKNWTDDGEWMESDLLIGPIRTAGGQYHSGSLKELIGTLALDGGDVHWSVQIANAPEAAAKAPACLEGDWTPGRNYTDSIRREGNAFCLRLRGGVNFLLTDKKVPLLANGEYLIVRPNRRNGPWAFEEATAIVQRSGAAKKE